MKIKINFLSAVLLYNGQRDGVTADSWHKKCYFDSNTLTSIHTEYHDIFGCFGSIPFDKQYQD